MNLSFKKNGYLITKIKHKQDLKKLRNQFISTFSTLSTLRNGKKIKNDKTLNDLYHSERKYIWTSVYDILKLEPLLFKLAGSEEIINLSKLAGIKKPTFATKPYVRVDMPNDQSHTFGAHQDWIYNKNSRNSITIWIPLQNCSTKNGCLKVVPKSHKNRTIYKNKKNIIQNTKNLRFADLPLKLGEILLFSQFLVHKSGINSSQNVRFSVQFRITDLLDKEYAKRNYFVIKN